MLCHNYPTIKKTILGAYMLSTASKTLRVLRSATVNTFVEQYRNDSQHSIK